MSAIEVEAPSRQVRRAQLRQAEKAGLGPSQSARSSTGTDRGETPGKGLFDGNCNRTACQDPIAGDNWFNTSTRAYYCRRCAHLINVDAVRFDGIRICVKVEGTGDQPEFPYDEMMRIRAERTRRLTRGSPHQQG